jgi:hypothetical protein
MGCLAAVSDFLEILAPVLGNSGSAASRKTPRTLPRLAAVLGTVMLLGISGSGTPASAQQATGSQNVAQARPNIVIHPRQTEPGPDAKRHCRSWLAQENRASGTVIVPEMRCWWQ